MLFVNQALVVLPSTASTMMSLAIFTMGTLSFKSPLNFVYFMITIYVKILVRNKLMARILADRGQLFEPCS